MNQPHVPAVVHYSGFRVLPELEDACRCMVEDVAERCHSSTTRYATQAFLRARLGAVLGQHGLSPEVLEPDDEQGILREVDRSAAFEYNRQRQNHE